MTQDDLNRWTAATACYAQILKYDMTQSSLDEWCEFYLSHRWGTLPTFRFPEVV